MFHKSKKQHFLIVLIIITSLLGLQGCTKDDVKEVEVTTETALEMYSSAKRALNSGAWAMAEGRYKSLRSHYPFGHYTEQGTLELAYAQYKKYSTEEAVVNLDRFIKNYPAHDNLDYAYYLKGLIYFGSEKGFFQKMKPDEAADRNQENIKNAFTAFKNFLERYPDSKYAPDGRKRMVFLKNQLAAYELLVAKYYLRRDAPIAALNRAKFVLESFQETPAAANALALMIESYTMVDEVELAEQSRELLQKNYPNHEYLRNGEIDLKTKLIAWSDFWPF
ncbi:MAG: outer membrane protein assembly factor BamD [Proteobacteria bacterium]|nr:outer membrane protein assembly factor BamD [Pseudomonadota bacterium]